MFERKIPENDMSNEDYLGNIWGWRFSMISLFFIMLFVGWLLYSHLYRETPPPLEENKTEEVDIG